jgi:CRP-like cAMP-binding protein
MDNQIAEKNAFRANLSDGMPLVEYINQGYPLRKEIVQFILSKTYELKLDKGKFLLKPGEICGNYYYINKGVLRSFIKYGKKEINIWINPENEITTAIRSMSSNKPSDEYIQALEDCELVVIPFEAMQELYERFPEMNMVGRKFLEEYYAASEERVYICRIPDARSRYQHFIETRPELVNRIPLKHVASYLGITLETLSRLRAKKATKRA